MIQRPRLAASRRALATVATVVALTSVTAGCGGGGSDAGGDSSADPSGPGSTSDGATDGATDEAADGAYLPVPEGVELTEPGADLDLGDDADLAWEPREETVGVLGARVEAIERTSFEESFRGWELGAEVESRTPYFVRAQVRNEGDVDLAGLTVPLYAVDDAGTLVEATRFTGTFEPCPAETFPKSFAPGTRAELCLVYLAAPGRRITGVGFRPTQDFDQITWTGKVTEVGDAEKDEKGGEGDRRDGGG